MPRDIPVGNGTLLVNFDREYRIRDFYYPHVGMEDHTGGHPFRFGIWADGLFSWIGADWNLSLRYVDGTLVTDVRGENARLGLRFRSRDVVDFHLDLFLREIRIENLGDKPRDVRLFFHHDFHIYGSEVGDTAYYDPASEALLHYKQRRYFLIGGRTPLGAGIREWATGTKEQGGSEGTWRDAEDGVLGKNPIAQGAVDSTVGLPLKVPAKGAAVAHYWIAVAKNYADVNKVHNVVLEKSPQEILTRTANYWRFWIDKEEFDWSGIPEHLVGLLRRSLLILRTQIDSGGAVIAANDSDITQFARDTYSYMWPRDGALVAHALDKAGYEEASRAFFLFCAGVIRPEGYLLHKYNPDGSLGSSWHPWLRDARPDLPIQEDETALVLWALWKHFDRFRDVEFVKPFYRPLIRNAGDFLVRFRDPITKLPLPSHDLWEERYGVHTFTVATVIAGLHAAGNFASSFGEVAAARTYFSVSLEIADALGKYLWSEKEGRFARSASRTPSGYDLDLTIDASLYGLFAFEALPVDDPRVAATMEAVRKRLWVRTEVGGIARYENDSYHRVSSDTDKIPGNPWFLCTLWMAQYEIARARDLTELERALPILDWVHAHALPSGVLAEQVHPFTNEPLSVSPLSWSHATVVLAIFEYLEKRANLLHGERGRAFLHTGKRYAGSSCVIHHWDEAEQVPEKVQTAKERGVEGS